MKGIYIGFPQELFMFIEDQSALQFTTKVSFVRQMIMYSYRDQNFESIRNNAALKKMTKPWNYAEIYVTLPDELYEYIEELCEKFMLTRTAVIRQITNYYYNEERD